MYSQVIYIHSDSEKNSELLKELKERNRISNSEGYPHMVAQQMFTEGFSIVTVTQYENLASLQEWYENNATTESYRASAARIRAAMVRPATLELMQSLAQTERSGPVNFFLSATSFAAPGNARDLRVALEKSFPDIKAPGAVMRVLQRCIAPEEGASVTHSIGFSSLTGLETMMEDPSFGAGGAAIGELLNRPVRQRLYRVLMPFGGS